MLVDLSVHVWLALGIVSLYCVPCRPGIAKLVSSPVRVLSTHASSTANLSSVMGTGHYRSLSGGGGIPHSVSSNQITGLDRRRSGSSMVSVSPAPLPSSSAPPLLKIRIQCTSSVVPHVVHQRSHENHIMKTMKLSDTLSVQWFIIRYMYTITCPSHVHVWHARLQLRNKCWVKSL